MIETMKPTISRALRMMGAAIALAAVLRDKIRAIERTMAAQHPFEDIGGDPPGGEAGDFGGGFHLRRDRRWRSQRGGEFPDQLAPGRGRDAQP